HACTGDHSFALVAPAGPFAKRDGGDLRGRADHGGPFDRSPRSARTCRASRRSVRPAHSPAASASGGGTAAGGDRFLSQSTEHRIRTAFAEGDLRRTG